MQKYYLSIKGGLIFIVMCSGIFVVVLQAHTLKPMALMALLAAGFMLTMTILKMFFQPIFMYDEKGFITLWLGDRQEGKWNNVKNIGKGFRLPGVSVNTNDGNALLFTYFMTKNYFKALTEIVRYVRKNSPNAPIDSAVLKRLKMVDK